MKAGENSIEMLLMNFDENALFNCLDLNDATLLEADSPDAKYPKAASPCKPVAPVPRHKRESHIKAELKRRGRIKNGFHELENLVPNIDGKGDSKAAKLNKAVDYCRMVKKEKEVVRKEISLLENEVGKLSAQIKECQTKLPASGVSGDVTPPSRCGTPGVTMESMCQEYVKKKIDENWKFWIFNEIMRPAVESYVASVNSTDPEKFQEQVENWTEKHCSLTALRMNSLTGLRQISKTTSILTNPGALPDEVRTKVSTAHQGSS